MSRRRNKSSGAKWLFLFLVLAFLGLLFFLFTYAPVELDARSCPKDVTNTGTSLAVLLDTTEQYGPSQIQQVVNHIYDEVDGLSQYDRLMIFSVDQTGSKTLPRDFDFCKPGPDQTKSPVAEKFAVFVFKRGLQDSLKALQGDRPSSPIISSLASVASQLRDDGTDRRIILVSDMIEFSEAISMYRRDWLSVAERDKERLRKLRPMLDGITVDVLFLARPDNDIQNKDLINWWRGYLSDAGAYINQIKPITGS